ncbi:transglycosylase domain-containing protein [Leifsonia sp. NPDC056665]|uniref:transglycosylase domain-containing protein n=1 Tax=Leifsonia sp. NPDC056665 TaxID=3345901 RepID=UPI00368EEC5E
MGEQNHNSNQPRGRVAAAAGFVALSVTSGVLISAMVAPVVAVAGVATGSGVHLFETLPEALTPDALAQTSDFYAKNRAGEPVLLASVYEQNRKNVAWEAISPYVKDALTSTEDPRFYTHGGVDIPSALRAAIGNASSGKVDSGASTITMQYVKNVLVQRAEAIRDKDARTAAYTEATKTSMDRKLREMRLAIGLEKALPKDQIMLGYLNIAHFGGSVYGIEAAAEYYFGVTAADLTLAQAASLVATVNAPNDFRIDDPDNIGDNKFRRDNDVLAAMLEAKKITRTQHDEAVATPIEPNITPPSTGCVTANALGAGFFCDYVQRVIENENVLPDPTDSHYSALTRGGYDIYTTLDLDLQASAVAAVDAYVPRATDVLDLGSSLVTVEPGTGRILAMAQNKAFNADPDETSPENTAVNYSTDSDYGGSNGFQAGSTYKVFTLAEWLKNGHSLNDVVNGDPRALTLSSFKDSCQGSGTGTYSPKNDSGARPGNISVRAATAGSVNGAYFSMAQKLDQCEIRKTAEAFGVKRADGKPLTSYVSDVLGTNEVAPVRMAAAFAAIADEGVYCAPIAIDRIVGPDGAEVPVPASACTEAVAPEIAASMASALQGVTRGGTGSASNPNDGVPVFGKTGTTDSEKDTWFVGSTTRLTTAVWVGNVTGDVSLRRSKIGGIQADQLRHRVWKQYMTAANAVFPGGPLPDASARPVRD